MTAPQADPTVLISDIPDLSDIRLDEDAAISQYELTRIVRGSDVSDELSTPVSAFNSSI